MKERGFVAILLPLVLILIGGLGAYAYTKYLSPQIVSTLTQKTYSPEPLNVGPLPGTTTSTSTATVKASSKATSADYR